MSSVRSLDDITQELERFFDCLYGDQSGYVYSPTKDPHTDRWEQVFFKWPSQRAELIAHTIAKSATHEVYNGVALFKTDRATKESILGTNYVWAEFDGELPELGTTPPPSIKIQSSLQGYEHWYWKLEGFITDTKIIENITQRLAYKLNADLSCWDANQVLRPPSTTHHSSQKMTAILTMGSQVTPIQEFARLPEVPTKILQEEDIHHIPVVLDVIAKYPWKQEDIQFFREMELATAEGKPKGHGYRSSALTKLGHICIEMGMSNAEALSILFNANGRWKKFSEARAKKQLLAIISYCRAKHPVDPITQDTAESEEIDTFKIYTFNEFIDTQVKLEWVMPGLIHKKGLIMISGPPRVGKSQFLMRLAEHLAKAQQFLKWQIPRPMKTLFISMEMPHEEIKYFYETMRIKKDPLMENSLVMPLGHAAKLTSPRIQNILNKKIEEYQPEGIFFDSFGRAVGDDLISEKNIFSVFDYVDFVLRGQYGLFVGFIHHNRKAQIGNKKPNTLDDLYGNQYIGSSITTGINMWPVPPAGSNEIEVSCLKLRMEKEFSTFNIKRTPDLDFELNESKILAADSISLLGVSNTNNNSNSNNLLGHSLIGDI